MLVLERRRFGGGVGRFRPSLPSVLGASGSGALVGFGVDSPIEPTSAGGLFWRLGRAGPNANAVEEANAER